MKNGMVIIDADGHAVDYEPVYRERLPEQVPEPGDDLSRRQFRPHAKRQARHSNARHRRHKTSPTMPRKASNLQIIYPNRRVDAGTGARARLCDRLGAGPITIGSMTGARSTASG